MSIDRISSVKISDFDPESGVFYDADQQPVDVSMYSRCKYGDSAAAWEYGTNLAMSVIDERPDLVERDDLIVTAPGYVYSPKPTTAIARCVLAHINATRVMCNREPARLLRIHEQQMGNPNYATSDRQEREAELARQSDEHYIPTSLVDGVSVIIVDDCVITGTTESRQRAIVQEHNPRDITFAYAIEVDHRLASTNPQIEHVMNTSHPIDLKLISELISRREFTLNSRVLNFILSSNVDDLILFLDACPTQLTQEIYEATMNSTIEFIERHSDSVAILNQIVNKNRKPTGGIE